MKNMGGWLGGEFIDSSFFRRSLTWASYIINPPIKRGVKSCTQHVYQNFGMKFEWDGYNQLK